MRDPQRQGELRELIEEGARVVGITLPEGAAGRLARYGVLLCEAGGRAGFRPPGDLRVLVGKHLVDGMTCLLASDFPPGSGAVDVGSGVGLPGVVVAICRPEAGVVLLEPRGRRWAFLRWVVWQLGIQNAEARRGRAEDLVREGRRFDRVLVRALARFPEAVRICLPLVGKGGEMVVMGGPRGEREAVQAGGALKGMGAGVSRFVRVELPWQMGRRVLVVVARKEGGGGSAGNKW